MPPRAVKKTAGPGPKKTPRAIKKLQNQPETTEETPEKTDAVSTPPVVLKKEAVVAVEEQVVKVPGKADSVPKPVADAEPKPVADVVAAVKKEDEVKESVDEYEKSERLELEDNDSETETEYGTVYLEIEQEDAEEVDQMEEEVEEDGDAVEEADSDETEDRIYQIDEGMEDRIEQIDEETEDRIQQIDEETEDRIQIIDEEEDEKTAGGGGGQEHASMVHVEEEEHHEVVQERRKRKEFEIFVGGLDKDATEDDLRKVFSKVGDVVEIRLMMNAQTKKNKGFAFLRFATVEQAKRAVSELKNPVVNGKQCGVSPSQDSDTLFLGNICKTWTKEALKEKLKHYGVDNIDDLTLVEDSNNEGMNRGFAFLEFSSRSDAMDAFKLLQKRGVTFGVDRSAKVSFADSFVDPGDEIMAQVKTVFVDGLPASWDEDRIRGLLKKYGTLEKIELARNMPSAKRKDFGFVTFNSHDAAVTCAKSINNSELGDGDSKAKVRARLSRPLQRGKGNHATHGSFRPGHASGRSVRGPWAARTLPHPMSRSLPSRGARGLGPRAPLSVDRGPKRPVGLRDRRPPLAMPVRERHIVPSSRSCERRVPVPSYARSSLKKEHSRRNEMPLRSRAIQDYDSKAVAERRPSYREPYAARGSGYPELPRSTSRVAARQSYMEDGYGQRFERPPLGYREGRARDYDTISGSKRSYSAMDDVPPRYTDAGARHTRPRYDYDPSDSGAHYGDDYNDRLGRSNVGYGSSRTSISSPHGLYSSRQGMSYGKGSFGAGAGDSSGVYASSFSNDYMSRGADVGGSSYSSLYSTRSMGGSSYMGGGGSGSYY